jgi:hypothetical protein
MPLSITTSSSIGTSATLATTADGTQTLDSYSSQQTLLDASTTGSSSDDGSLALVLGGEATAVGEDTLADGSMLATVDGTGIVAVASGSAEFEAVAASTDGEAAFATADSYGAVSGADFLVVIGSNSEFVHQEPDESLSLATSQTTIFGLDTNSDSSVPLAESTLSDPALLTPMDEADPSQSLADSSLAIEGNVATLDVVAYVLGANTMLEVDASLLAVEDTLSTVNAGLIAVVG